MNLAFGPLLSESWHKMIQEALQVFIRDGGPNDHLFLLFYEHICDDMDLADDDLFCQQEHRKHVLGLVVECFIFQTKGTNCALRPFLVGQRRCLMRCYLLGTPGFSYVYS